MNAVTAIVQARTSSTRLPGKVLLNISGQPMLSHVVNRLKLCQLLDKIIIATTTLSADDAIEQLAKVENIECFRGDQNNVLERYYNAAKAFNVETVVRITSDCPLIDPQVTDMVIEEHLDAKADYTSNILERTWPRGLDTEVFTLSALDKAYKGGEEPYQREHVTPYIWQSPNLFKLVNIAAEGKFRRPDLRLTVDTPDDLRLIREIYSRMNRHGHFFLTDKVIDLIDLDPDLAAINSHVRQKQL